MIPEDLRGFLPADTVRTWESVGPLVPAPAYLAGGTAITVHLRHRISRDLDFFFDHDIDLDGLARALAEAGPFAVTMHTETTLSGVFSATRIQFLDARSHHAVDDDSTVGTLRVASMRDLVAMKLKVIEDRGELRDYFDLMAIEQAERGAAETGLGDFLDRYRPKDSGSALLHIVEALGYLDDVDEDDLVPRTKNEVASYWTRRQPAVLRAMGRIS
ncbi:MAG: nucleotidyl transferase AbiEii/AbiGii toxin family protein [Actinomycetota bacterium]